MQNQCKNAQYGAIAHYYYHYQQQQPAQHYYHHQNEHEYYHEHHEEYYHHHEQQPDQFYDFGKIKEFHDPWEDYYDNLTKEQNQNVIEDNTQYTVQSDKFEEQEAWQSESTSEWHRHEEIEQNEAILNTWIQETKQYYNHCQYENEQKPIEQYTEHQSNETHKPYVFQEARETSVQSTNKSSSDNYEKPYEGQTKNYENDIHNINTARNEVQDPTSIHTNDIAIDIVCTSNSTDKEVFCSEEDVYENETENKNNKNEVM